MHRRDHLRLRLDGSMGGAPGHRVHPAGMVGIDGFPRRSGGPADLRRRRAGGVHGRRVRRVRGPGPAKEGPRRRSWRAPRPLDARGDHVDAKRGVAALAVACGASDQAVRRGAVDRAGEGRLRRHQHGDRPAVAGLRRDGGLSGIHRDSRAAVPAGTVGSSRLDTGTHRAVDARAHRRRDRRARSAVPVADRSAGQRFDDPGHGPHA